MFVQRLSYAYMYAHAHTNIHPHTVTTENLCLLCFFLLFLSGIKPNSKSAFCSKSPFGSRNLFLLWELCPVHRLECAYMVGKLKPWREEMETDVQDRRKRAREIEKSL